MADPTPLELQQQIDDLRSLISPNTPVPSGPEFSYPVVGQPMSDTMWQYVTLGLGDGILDEGGQPYWFRGRDNTTSTVRITVSTTTGTAQALLRGFYHRMTEDKTFTLPPGVSVETTYYFCLTYSPVGLGTADGPITLQMYTGTPPITQGRFHVILWTLTRKPSQLLTDATYKKYRPRVAPSITVAQKADMPDPATVLWGSTCLVHRTNEVFVAVGDSNDGDEGPKEWKNLTAPSENYIRPDGVYKWAGHGARPGASKIGQVVYLEGRLARGDRFDGQTYNAGTDYEVMNLPSSLAPKSERRYEVKMSSFNANRTAAVSIYPDGRVVARPNSPELWIGLDGINYTLTR